MAMPTNKAMYMVERHDWEAIPPKWRFKTERPVNYIILRYTNTDPCTDYDSCCETVRNIQKKHMDEKSGADIMYSFLIGGDSKVYHGSGWRYSTNKEMEYAMHEFDNIDIAYIGRNKDDVTPDMRWAARKLLDHSMSLSQVAHDAKYIGDQEAIDLLFT